VRLPTTATRRLAHRAWRPEAAFSTAVGPFRVRNPERTKKQQHAISGADRQRIPRVRCLPLKLKKSQNFVQ
jgi:hypothetical protein